MITCIIRNRIDPTKKPEFEQYARDFGQAIPRCGASAPHAPGVTS
jgi:hypothetical protein